MLRQAANEGWDVPGECKNEALYQCLRIMLDPEARTKNKLAAARVLVAADRADISRARLRLEAEKLRRPVEDDDARELIEHALSIVDAHRGTDNRDQDQGGDSRDPDSLP